MVDDGRTDDDGGTTDHEPKGSGELIKTTKAFYWSYKLKMILLKEMLVKLKKKIKGLQICTSNHLNITTKFQ